MTVPATLAEAAQHVLQTADARDKAAASRQMAELWRSGAITAIGTRPADLQDRPARPTAPELKAPTEMPKRRAANSVPGRMALLHALAHIELNAVDLSWDLLARFADMAVENTGEEAQIRLPSAYFDDWVQVADDEGKHFLMLSDRMADFEGAYGDLPAHDGLWQSALDTASDITHRLAIVPLVLEARGLDVTPAMISGLTRAGDEQSASILQVIHDDEITHVATGHRWFVHVCRSLDLPARETWQDLVTRLFKGHLKPPFNHTSRSAAGFDPDWYEPMSA
ncbi:MAG: ferritin-like domain-containing protein [Alphaproteobacteria bacterium]